MAMKYVYQANVPATTIFSSLPKAIRALVDIKYIGSTKIVRKTEHTNGTTIEFDKAIVRKFLVH